MTDVSTVVRDAIWGDISLGPRELALIDTDAFQRLRRVRQLGFTDLVFPGAHHTRFEHSLGVFHLAGAALERFPDTRDEERRAFLAAALLHDVGHYPFSHALEELEVGQIRRHEDIARDHITGALAPTLESAWEVDPLQVAAFVDGTSESVLGSLLDSALDVDKLDYLVRDARAANVPYGLVDVQRLIASLTLWHDDTGESRVGVDAKGLASLQSLIFAKHLMFATVYWHHACRAAVVMLLRAVQDALRGGALDSQAIERVDDAGLLAALSRESMPETTRELSARLTRRRLYKRVHELGAGRPEIETLWFRPAQRATLEDGWAAAIGASEGHVLLDIPEPKSLSQRLPAIVRDGKPASADAGVEHFSDLQRSVRRIRVFASDAETAGRARSLFSVR